MGFGNLGLSELLVLAVLVLVFFGPRRIPEIARSLGGALREFRRGWNEIRREIEDLERDVSDEDDRRRRGARRRPPPGRVEPGDWDDGAGDTEAPPDRGRPAEDAGEEPEGGRRDAEGAGRPPGDRPTGPDAEGRDPEADAGR